MNHVEPTPIPITIVAGYLGSGKTTLLNYILSAGHGRRIGVLVNDFGSINVDAELITQVEEGMMTLANGCVCCSIRTDLIQAVLLLADRTDPPEHIVIESSGVADPAGVYEAFLQPEIRNSVLVDGVITVVDAEQVLGLPDAEAKLARTQVAGGDLIVLNKTDLVDTDTRSNVKAWIREAKPTVQIFDATHGRIPMERLLGVEHLHESSLDDQSSSARLHHDIQFETWTFESHDPLLHYDPLLKSSAIAFADGLEFTDPRVSPLYADLSRGFSPSIITEGTKCIFLSSSARMYQALEAAGQETKLDVYEGMWQIGIAQMTKPGEYLFVGPGQEFQVVPRPKATPFIRLRPTTFCWVFACCPPTVMSGWHC